MRIGARGSDLAQWQANWVAQRLNDAGIKTQQVIVKTHGDRVQDRPLHQLGVQGAFTKELEDALLRDEIDLAVHSFKDMALVQPPELKVIAVSEREDPADLLVIRKSSVDHAAPNVPVPEGAVVGTSAVRRGSQLQAMRSDIKLNDLRGNVDTRLRKLSDGMYDAIFLASAGAKRLGLTLDEFHVVRLDPAEFIPSPAQGALAVEMRSDDADVDTVRAAVNDEEVSIAISAERALLKAFGGGCSLPLGGYCTQENGNWRLRAFWGGDGGPIWTEEAGPNPEVLASLLLYRIMK